jgi:hypothetical protein
MTDIMNSILMGQRVAFLHIGGNSPKQNTVIVDYEDVGMVLSAPWYVGTVGYAVRGTVPRKTGKMLLLHRELLNTTSDKKVDHRNGDTLDDRRINLRECTHAQNISNQQRQKSNKSGYKGVYFNRRSKKWEANIAPNGKGIYLGRFENILDAAQAYNDAAIKYYGEFARLNKIPIN